jgi:hypothetical protein
MHSQLAPVEAVRWALPMELGEIGKQLYRMVGQIGDIGEIGLRVRER